MEPIVLGRNNRAATRSDSLVARILIAAEHRANREALAALLETAGHEVLSAPEGSRALELARSHRPELVITDVLMPIMDGYELTRRLKLEPQTAGISVIFYTAYFGGQDAKELAAALGVARVLVKPSDNAAILRAVGEVLSARPAAPAGARADLDREHLRLMVDQLLEKTGALEAQQQRIERMNRTLAMLSARVRDFFDEEEMRLLHELAGDVSFALHHLEQKAQMDYLAYHDSLTDLPNRSLFTDRMTQALNAARREKRFAAAVFVDVERFRMVNETFGRKAGDDLLRTIGARLRAAAREQDSVARIGADHFAIAVAPFERPGDTTHWLIDRFEQAFTPPITIDGVELRVALKAGIGVFPADGESTESLCANAETALSKAKELNQRYLFYAPEMNARVAESLAMENRLRRALEEGRLALHYQPKIDVKTGAVAGPEALIRWFDPELGSVPPATFVGLLEETGMVLAAGRWALRQAAADIRHWQSLGITVPRIAVNVSAIQLRQQDFVDTVLEALTEMGEGKPLLDLEITESVLVDDIEASTRKLQTLRRAGVEVSVDDFGTGYCSLSYLARLPVDMLKIDRSFVVRMRDAGYPRNIVAMIVSLAHTLGLKVIAEGVE